MITNKTLFWASLIFICAFSVYLYTTVPSLTGDDSGELAGVGATLGIAHSPGYPIYSMVSRAVVLLLPFGNDAYRVNLVSGLFIAAASSLLFFVGLLLTASIPASLAAALIFAFSKVVWAMANTTEVYGVTAFFVALLCCFLFKKELANYRIVFFVFGFSMAAHYTVGFLLFGILLWVYQNHYKKNLWEVSLNSALYFALGLSVIIFIYFRALAIPVFGWEDPKTLDRFWQVVARLRYGSLSLAQGGAPPLQLSVIIEKTLFFAKVISQNITLVGFAVFLAGLWFCLKDRLKGWLLIVLMVLSGPGFLYMANVTLGKGSSELLERFFFLTLMFVVLIFAKALAKLPKYGVYPFIILPLFLLNSNFEALNRRNEYMFYDYANNILKTAPYKTTLLSDRADEMEFVVGYLHFNEHKRDDIRFIDCNAGITRSIYGDDYYKIWGKPRLEIRYAMETSIIANSKLPVYYSTFNAEKLNIPKTQEGLLYNAKPAIKNNKGFPFWEIYATRYESNIKRIDGRMYSLTMSYFNHMANYCFAVENYSLAEDYFYGMRAFDGSNRWTVSAGFLYHSKGMLDKAEACYLTAIDSGFADEGMLTNLGAIYDAQNKLAQAEAIFKKVLEINANNTQANYNLGVVCWKQQRWQEAAKAFEYVLKVEPSNESARVFMQKALNAVKSHQSKEF